MDNLPEVLIMQFIEAVANNRERASELLSAHPNLISARWMHDETIVHFLAVEGFPEAVTFLAEHGADLNAVNEFGDTPFIDVAVLGFNDIAEVLLRHGANPNAGSATRNNALDCAVRAGNSGLVAMLLEAGANARYLTDLGETVFDAIPKSDQHRKDILTVLAQHGIKADAG
jgi:ankyrin repeat protein